MKSLTDTAKAVLVRESEDPTPDRDAKLMTPNKATLRPGAGAVEGRFANPGAMSSGEGEYEDLGPAAVNPTDVPPSAKAAGRMGKDNSKSAQAAVPAEPSMMEEEIEISEELESFINQMMEEGYSEDEISEAIAENFEIVEEEKEDDDDEDDEKEMDEEAEEEEDDKDDKKKDMKEEVKKPSRKSSSVMKEHVDALLKGENLSEDFRVKAETLFESAVSLRVNEEVEVLEEAYEKALEEELQIIAENLSENIDSYLNYVVEEWMKENEIAIETGLRTEITEEFISGLKNLFAESYIDIPDEKVNVAEELGKKVEELESKLNEQIETNIELKNNLLEAHKFEIFVNACDDLTDTQAEKLRTLAESVDVSSVEEFQNKLEVLKESYFPEGAPASKSAPLDLIESIDGGNGKYIQESLSGPMAAYVKSLDRSLIKKKE